MKKMWKYAIDMPPVWLLIFMVGVYLQTRFWNPFGFENALVDAIGWVFILLGIWIFAWAFMQFRSHDTSIVPRNVPRSFIAKGPYKFSRNPIYLADAMILLGFSLIQGSWIGILVVPVFSRLITVRFINGEEAGLKAEFPKEFAEFCANTRRWI